MTVFGYVFLENQGKQLPDFQREEQERSITQFGKTQGFDVDEFVIEVESLSRIPFRKRSAAAGILNRCLAGDVLIVCRSDWVLTSAGEGARIVKSLGRRGVALYCIDLGENITTPSERRLVVSEGNAVLILKILEGLAAMENSSHGERIRAGKKMKKEQGKYLGGPIPFGWQVDRDGFLVQEPAEQEVIGRIISLREQRRSYRAIAAELTARHGIRLSHEGIRRLLENDSRRKAAQRSREFGS